MQYWNDSNLDGIIRDLITKGAVELPSVQAAPWRQDVYDGCLRDLDGRSYGENLNTNLQFLNHFEITQTLRPKLYAAAVDNWGFKGRDDDQYNVCRLVRPGQTSEGYRGHFDSHLFTLVTPINIPAGDESTNRGQLHYFPAARRMPKNDLVNLAGKAYFKKYNSADGFIRLGRRTAHYTKSFADYQPLLFLGMTTYHGNSPVEHGLLDNRMTILTHFFDPGPRHGIGAIMRRLRKR